jgi:predicted alpha/beta superfamily hydrolase
MIRKHEAKVEEFVIESTELGQKRQVLVYTPALYEAESSYYNVIYMFDGQDLELFSAANGITHLLADGEKFIFVGINATFIEEEMYTRNNDLIP